MSSEPDVAEILSQKSSSHPPPSSLSSRSSSVDPNAINIGTNSPENGPINIPITVDDDVQQNRSPTPSAATASVAVAVPPPSKPKSVKHPRPRSPSPSPPPPPPPLRTIRLDIRLGGPDNYEVDISGRAKETGQRPNTPIPTGKVTVDSSDSEGDDEGAVHKKKKKARGAATEYYDIHDPFIDDSELAIDERTYFAQTKQKGFYVSSGEVALMKDKSPKKPKSKKVAPTHPQPESLSTAGASTSKLHPISLSSIDLDPGRKQREELGLMNGKKRELSQLEGTKDSPIALGSDIEEDGYARSVDSEGAGAKRKRYLTVLEPSGKKRKVVDMHSFHPELQVALEGLKQAIARENWEVKGKFPPSLKPILSQVAVLAIKLNEYDEHFFNLMPVLFPYNKFTMTKLIKRTVFQEHLALLVNRQETLLEELTVQATEGFPKAEEEWDRTIAAWDKRQEKARAEAVDPNNSDLASGNATRQNTEDAGSGMDVDTVQEKEKDGAPAGKEKEVHPPSKKYRMTDAMKAIVWQLVLLSNECCRIENEKNTLEGSTVQMSDQGLRKVLYQKIVAAFPPGWMTSGQISRDVSSMKKRFEKEAMDND